MRRPGAIVVALLVMLPATAAAVVIAAAIPLVLALSHYALEVLVRHHPPLG
jgi:hypothetical protein